MTPSASHVPADSLAMLALSSKWLDRLLTAWLALSPRSKFRQWIELKLMHALYRRLLERDFVPCYQKGWPRTYLEREVKASVFG